MNEERLARALGWLSFGLGVAGILAPRRIGKMIGVGNHPLLLRAVGVRELAAGIGLLSRRRPAGWIQTRVAGDAVDLALLGAALASKDTHRGRVAATAAVVAGVTALDALTTARFARSPGKKRWAGRVQETVTVYAFPEELYRFWQDFQNLPRFMKNLESVRVLGPTRSHWVAKAPAGTTVEWDAEIIADRPNELIAWRSLDGADVDHAGSVRFKPARRGRATAVRVEMEYSAPGGTIGANIARLFGDAPEQQVREDLRRLKELIEAGELVPTAGRLAQRQRSPLFEKYERTRHP